MTASGVLVVEDAEAIRVPVVTALGARGFRARGLGDGSELEAELAAFAPDVVVLDVMLPGRDGFALLEVVRRTSTAAVVMLTARDSTADRVQGLSAGADDYLVKPFALAELLARIHAVLRRTRPTGGVVTIGEVDLAADAVEVRSRDVPVELTTTERRVLACLLAQPGRALSKTQILTAVWGYEGFDDNVVEVNVSSLRRKLEATGAARVLFTERGRGYRLGGGPGAAEAP